MAVMGFVYSLKPKGPSADPCGKPKSSEDLSDSPIYGYGLVTVGQVGLHPFCHASSHSIVLSHAGRKHSAVDHVKCRTKVEEDHVDAFSVVQGAGNGPTLVCSS